MRGMVAAIIASFASWGAIEWLFDVTPAQREALEGFTMILATLVLIWVSYWLLTKIAVQRWNAYVKDRMGAALASGSGFALASVAFLAVYREGLETILFYKALFLSAQSGTTPALFGGMAVGAVGLVAMYLAINAFGLRLPTRPFFAFTSAMLYYMAFVFAGKGIAELQGAGLIGITPVSSAPRIPAIGVYPTVETLIVQGILIGLAVLAFVRTRRRVPEPKAASPTPVPREPNPMPGRSREAVGSPGH
jgi:high-affinity iron transporter